MDVLLANLNILRHISKKFEFEIGEVNIMTDYAIKCLSQLNVPTCSVVCLVTKII